MSHSRIFYLTADKDNENTITDSDIYDEAIIVDRCIDYVDELKDDEDIQGGIQWLEDYINRQYCDNMQCIDVDVENRTITVEKDFDKVYNEKCYTNFLKAIQDVTDGESLYFNKYRIIEALNGGGGFLGVTEDNGYIEVLSLEELLSVLGNGTYYIKAVYDYHY